MKNSFITIAVIILAAVVTYMVFRSNRDNEYWEKRIARYATVADSLRQALNDVDRRIQQKDSILLLYMSSLDKTLEELNKETRKNVLTIRTHQDRQDSIIAEYCKYMVRELGQTPDVCK